MSDPRSVILFTCLLILCCATLSAQDRSALEKERKKLESDIQFNKAQLEKIDKDKQKSLSQIEILATQIDTRQKMIVNLNRDLDILNGNIHESEEVVSSLEKDLAQLKERYAEMLRYAYRNRSSLNDLVFILSAESFNDALKRLKYLQQYSEFRKRQADLIVETKDDLSKKLAELQQKKDEQQQLLAKEENHRQQLDKEKHKKDELVDSLKKKEKQLSKEIKKQQEQVASLNKQIEEIIRKEIIAARERERKEREEAEKAGKAGKTTTIKPNSSADVKLSNRFSENKGKLPWPVANGVITSSFGQHPHPAIPNLMIDNKGIDIKTDENAKVRAVFDGEVRSVRSVPGFDNMVIVKHGDFFTVYYKLKSVSVKTGDKVSTKQDIGIADGEMHFEVWQGEVRLNPALWIFGQ